MNERFDVRYVVVVLFAAMMVLGACGTVEIERVADVASATATTVVSPAQSQLEEAATATGAAVTTRQAQATPTVLPTEQPPTPTAVPATPTAEATATAVASETADGGSAEEDSYLIYRNDIFGFHLLLPRTWGGFEVTQNDHENVSNICFTFTGSPPFCVLQIDVYSKAAWESLENVPDNYYLAENEQFVFAAGPYQPECVQLDDFQCERHQEIPSMLEMFAAE